MLSTLEHELRHAHQNRVVSSVPCNSPTGAWLRTDDGREWVVATTADRKAGRVIAWLDTPGQYFYDTPKESEADYYSYWIRSKWPRPQENVDPYDGGASVENLCFNGKSERCKYLEARHGRRPSSYP